MCKAVLKSGKNVLKKSNTAMHKAEHCSRKKCLAETGIETQPGRIGDNRFKQAVGKVKKCTTSVPRMMDVGNMVVLGASREALDTLYRERNINPKFSSDSNQLEAQFRKVHWNLAECYKISRF